jgi:hypothetical protein
VSRLGHTSGVLAFWSVWCGTRFWTQWILLLLAFSKVTSLTDPIPTHHLLLRSPRPVFRSFTCSTWSPVILAPCPAGTGTEPAPCSWTLTSSAHSPAAVAHEEGAGLGPSSSSGGPELQRGAAGVVEEAGVRAHTRRNRPQYPGAPCSWGRVLRRREVWP